eukprot:Lithocolla_globosa_v1_NODE_3372_length_1688_cov_50.541947.p1 type:complete len:408 gc:universal NODE_3372_length_1688_cov_50.541947:1451-228(-)
MNMSIGKRRTPSSSMASQDSGKSSDKTTMNGIRFSDPDRPITVSANDGKTGATLQLTYTSQKVIGNGSFGVVFKAQLVGSNQVVAIKKVLQDKRFKNRELDIMRLVSHPNVVQLTSYFYSKGDKKEELFLNLVLEYVPETIHKAARHYAKLKQTMPILSVKLYMYQLFRSLAYIHCQGICHRDIKPQNLLLDPSTGVLKLCDFGSAKVLAPGEPNVAYICSRYYRAPELIFGASNYTTSIDMWSTGCVMAELLLGQPLFPGESGVDQLVEIIKILGTPTKRQIEAMNPNYTDFRFPPIKPSPWTKVFRARTPQDAVELISKLLEYTPVIRTSPIECLVHPFFDELRNPATKLHNGRDLPPLFNLTESELSLRPDLNRQLIPPHAEAEVRSRIPTLSFGGEQATAMES